MEKLLEFLRALLTVPLCISCGSRVDKHEEPLCEACSMRYRSERARNCTKCGFPHIECHCGVNVDGVYYPVYHVVPYDPKQIGVVSRIVFNAKDQYLRDNFAFMAGECVKALERHVRPEADWIITWIPRRKSAVRRIGHDQSRELAVRIAAMLGAEARALIKNQGETEQKSQKFDGRIRNAFASYKLIDGTENTVNGRTVVLVDDLITTGATQHVGVSLLRRAGAARIVPLTYARTDSEFKKYRMERAR